MAAISIDGTPMTALPSDADQINYDNSNSRLSDTQVQDAIDTLANDSSTFVGTTTQWNNLTTAQKKAYKYRLLTDDYTDASIGDLNALTTTDKSSVVGAVNEVNSNKQPKTDNNLQTTSKETTGAINELKSGLTNIVFVANLQNLSGYTASSFIASIANTGHSIYVTSATGSNKLSDMPETQAATYVVLQATYYIKLFVFTTNGHIYGYDGYNWITYVGN